MTTTPKDHVDALMALVTEFGNERARMALEAAGKSVTFTPDPHKVAAAFRAVEASARALAAVPASPSSPVYLVATGEVHEGQETYTRHEARPPLCDAETLYISPQQAGGVPAGWRSIESAPKEEELLGWREDCGVLLIMHTSFDRFASDQECEDTDEETLFQKDWFGSGIPGGFERLEGSEVPTHWMPMPAGPVAAAPSPSAVQPLSEAQIDQWRKKPVVVQAFLLGDGNRPDWWWDAVSANKIITRSQGTGNPFDDPLTHAEIHTLEGVMRADRGDWIIRGVRGEIYPCKPEIFAETYEPAGIVTPKEPGHADQA